jgi:8-oxo-dGTP diphosphatase
MDIIKVVCGIIYRKQDILICRRNSSKSFSGLWEFPGGKVEIHEQLEQALKRELLEELGMYVDVQEHFATSTFEYDNVIIELIAYKCEFLNATFKMTEHDAYKWIKTRSLNITDLTPADIPIAKKLIELEK